MSNSLAEQLANVKLKPSKDKTKDFSDPKLAGEREPNSLLSPNKPLDAFANLTPLLRLFSV